MFPNVIRCVRCVLEKRLKYKKKRDKLTMTDNRHLFLRLLIAFCGNNGDASPKTTFVMATGTVSRPQAKIVCFRKKRG